MDSPCIFKGDIDIVDSDGILLGNNNLYLGLEADVIVKTALDISDAGLQLTSGFIASPAGDAENGQGRVCKEYSDIGDEFLFPVGMDGGRYTPIQIKLSCANNVDFNNLPAVDPFPYISVRAILNQGSPQGHPYNEGKQTVWVYWVVQGEEDIWEIINNNEPDLGLPQEPYPLNGSIGFSGMMYFHNNYRSGSADLYSAVYWPNNETSSDPTNQNSLVNDGTWYLNGSVETGTFTGMVRNVPFGYIDPKTNKLVCTIGFGDYSIGLVGQLMPVELTSFSARYYMDDNSVQLKWLTATEENNLGFWVERSVDGESWETLPDFVQGAGNSSVPLSYEYTDNLDDRLAQVPKIAYRLRQVDRDGTIDYSSIVYVYTGSRPETVELYKAYPNPFNPSTTLSFSLEEAQNVTLRVYNTLGMEVATLLDNRSMDAGFHNIEFNGNDLVSGIYIAVLEAAGVVQQQKLVLSK